MNEMNDGLTLSDIADALDALADMMVDHRIRGLAGYNASFWRDAAIVLWAYEPRQLPGDLDELRERLRLLQAKIGDSPPA